MKIIFDKDEIQDIVQNYVIDNIVIGSCGFKDNSLKITWQGDSLEVQSKSTHDEAKEDKESSTNPLDSTATTISGMFN